MKKVESMGVVKMAVWVRILDSWMMGNELESRGRVAKSVKVVVRKVVLAFKRSRWKVSTSWIRKCQVLSGRVLCLLSTYYLSNLFNYLSILYLLSIFNIVIVIYILVFISHIIKYMSPRKSINYETTSLD